MEKVFAFVLAMQVVLACASSDQSISNPAVAESAVSPSNVIEFRSEVSSCYEPDRNREENLRLCASEDGLPQPGLFQTELNRKDSSGPCDIQIIDVNESRVVWAFLAAERQDTERCNVKASFEANCVVQAGQRICSWKSDHKAFEVKFIGLNFLLMKENSTIQPTLYARRILGKEQRGLLHSGNYRPSWQSGDCIYDVFPVLNSALKLSHVFLVGKSSKFAACSKWKNQQRLFICSPQSATGFCWQQDIEGRATISAMTARSFYLVESNGVKEFYFSRE